MKLVSPSLIIALGLFTACVASAEQPANTNIDSAMNQTRPSAKQDCSELPFLSCSTLRQLTPNPALTWAANEEVTPQRNFTERDNRWPWFPAAERATVAIDPFTVREWQRVFE